MRLDMFFYVVLFLDIAKLLKNDYLQLISQLMIFHFQIFREFVKPYNSNTVTIEKLKFYE